MKPKPNTSYQEGEKYIMEDVTSYAVAWIKKKNSVMSERKWAVSSSLWAMGIRQSCMYPAYGTVAPAIPSSFNSPISVNECQWKG